MWCARRSASIEPWRRWSDDETRTSPDRKRINGKRIDTFYVCANDVRTRNCRRWFAARRSTTVTQLTIQTQWFMHRFMLGVWPAAKASAKQASPPRSTHTHKPSGSNDIITPAARMSKPIHISARKFTCLWMLSRRHIDRGIWIWYLLVRARLLSTVWTSRIWRMVLLRSIDAVTL